MAYTTIKTSMFPERFPPPELSLPERLESVVSYIDSDIRRWREGPISDIPQVQTHIENLEAYRKAVVEAISQLNRSTS